MAVCRTFQRWTTYTCAFKPGYLMSPAWLNNPDCKASTEKWNDCRYNEKMQRIQRGLEGVVDELFTYSCPKFVAATPPRLDNLTVNSNQVQTAELQCWCLGHQHQMTHTALLIDQHAMHS